MASMVIVSGDSMTSRSTATPCQAWIVKPSPNASAGPLFGVQSALGVVGDASGRSLTMASPSNAHHGPAARASSSRKASRSRWATDPSCGE